MIAMNTKLVMCMLFLGLLAVSCAHGEKTDNNISYEPVKIDADLQCPPAKAAAKSTETVVPTIEGGLNKHEILGVIMSKLPKIEACYETYLKKYPKADGRLRVHFWIG